MKAFDSEKLKELFSNFVDESYSKIDDNEDCNTIIDQLVLEIDELKKEVIKLK